MSILSSGHVGWDLHNEDTQNRQKHSHKLIRSSIRAVLNNLTHALIHNIAAPHFVTTEKNSSEDLYYFISF